MTTLDELIDAEPEGAERARLQNVHELLREAGPPPELPPELESGPTLAMTLGRMRARRLSRRMFLPAVAAALILVAIIGIATGSPEQGLRAIPLRGTAAAPDAVGTLAVFDATDDTQQMKIDVQGVEPGLYAVYLVRKGIPWKKCGTFTVKNSAGDRPATINSPYLARPGDSWVVTRVTAAGHGPTILVPATT